MKKVQWQNMTTEQRLLYLDECAEKARARFSNQWHAETITLLNEKMAAGYRLTVEEFESYTGIKFSKDMTGKMKEILALSTCCLVNPLCRKRLENKVGICAECFAAATMISYESVTENTCYNYQVLSTVDIPENLIPYIDRKELRLEAFGDVGTVTQAKNYIKFALYNKQCHITAWTKNPWLYAMAFKSLGLTVCPDNLTIILSSQYLNTEATIPARFSWFIRKTFTVYTIEYLLENKLPYNFINCGGRRCKECQKCYVNAAKSPVNIREILKKDTGKAEKAGFSWSDGIAAAPTMEKTEKLDFSGLFR